MEVTERALVIPRQVSDESLLAYFGRAVSDVLSESDIPVRFVVTHSDSASHYCELGIMTGLDSSQANAPESIFTLRQRQLERTDEFTTVFLVPTGIGAEIGGHAGDATPAARLLASVSNTLITHPNVVNASDINELPENGLYVEGSVITRLLMGTVGLARTRSNRIMVVIDEHKDPRIKEDTVNAVSAARATLGLNGAFVVEMSEPVAMRTEASASGRAVGRVQGLERLCSIVSKYGSQIDAVALASVIDTPPDAEAMYFGRQGSEVNPWGGVEAMLTHAISLMYGLPCAHAPMARCVESANEHFGVVDPRMAAELVSVCFLHCVLKGLHRSPRIVANPDLESRADLLTVADVSCVVIPDRCLGLPTLAALEQGVPVIAVRENGNLMKNRLDELPFQEGNLIFVDNYLEAAGVISALKSGVSPDAVRRPLVDTDVVRDEKRGHSKVGTCSVQAVG